MSFESSAWNERLFVVTAICRSAQSAQPLAVFFSRDEAEQYCAKQALDWWFDRDESRWVMGDAYAWDMRVKMAYHVTEVPFGPPPMSLVARDPTTDEEAAVGTPILDRFMGAVWVPPQLIEPKQCWCVHKHEGRCP